MSVAFNHPALQCATHKILKPLQVLDVHVAGNECPLQSRNLAKLACTDIALLDFMVVACTGLVVVWAPFSRSAHTAYVLQALPSITWLLRSMPTHVTVHVWRLRKTM